jgi:hypothetical protein
MFEFFFTVNHLIFKPILEQFIFKACCNFHKEKAIRLDFYYWDLSISLAFIVIRLSQELFNMFKTLTIFMFLIIKRNLFLNI